MTALELLFNVDRTETFDEYQRDYKYWSIGKDGKYIFLNEVTNFDMFRDKSTIRKHSLDKSYHVYYIWDNAGAELPMFVPYEELEKFDCVEVKFDGLPFYEGCQRKPLVCVRGICDKNCSIKYTDEEDLDFYCFHEVPCTNCRPDWNCWTGKHPDFFNLLADTVEWVTLCSSVDTLVVLFDFTPNDYEPDLYFDSSYALRVKDKKIEIIGDTDKIEKLYKEFNEKYPTEDREIEKSINWGFDKYFFRF